MNKVCIGQGSTKNITVGNVYEILEEVDGRYTLRNDAGRIKEYHSRLFEDEVIVPVITHTLTNAGNNNINVEAFIDGVRFMNVTASEVSGLAGSCGITSFSGVNAIFQSLQQLPENVSQEQTRQLLVDIITGLVNMRTQSVIFSTNRTHNQFITKGDLNFLDVMSTIPNLIVETNTRNRNSGNDIVIYIYNNYVPNDDEIEEEEDIEYDEDDGDED